MAVGHGKRAPGPVPILSLALARRFGHETRESPLPVFHGRCPEATLMYRKPRLRVLRFQSLRFVNTNLFGMLCC